MSTELSPIHLSEIHIRPKTDVTALPITLPTRLFSRAEVLRRPSPVPVSSGVCFWYFRDIPSVVPTGDCQTLNGCTLLYLGIAPDRTNKLSASLLRCVIRNYRGNVEGSSLRRTLGILLEKKSGIPLLRVGSRERTILTPAGKRWFDAWMEMNVFVGWTAHPEPWMVGYELLVKLSLPLNISHNG